MVGRFIYLLLFAITLQSGYSQSDTQSLFQQTIHLIESKLATTAARQSENTPPGSNFWEKSGIAQLGYLILGTYQTFISSQDVPSCNYYPSCSHFAQDALIHGHFPTNIFLISDRLQRCNGLPGKGQFYPFDPQKGRYRDPITNYISKGKGK